MNSSLASLCLCPRLSRRPPLFVVAAALAIVIPGLAGCRHAEVNSSKPPAATAALASTNQPPATASSSTNKPVATAKRFTYTPRPYPVDERGFSPVDKALAKAYAREDLVADDAEGALNPYVLKVISAYPLDGSYPYHCSWTAARIRHLQRRDAGPVVPGHGRRQGLSGRLALQLLLRLHLRGRLCGP